jgi:hypothetical protein
MKRVEARTVTAVEQKTLRARVYCPICTHTVEADVILMNPGPPRRMKVAEGQRCRRCSTSLDAAYILDLLGGLN